MPSSCADERWCRECDVGPMTEAQLLEHEEQHAAPGKYLCTHLWCFFSGDRGSELREHYKNHPIRAMACFACQFRTNCYDLFERHERMSLEKGKHVHVCPGCDAHYPPGPALRSHIDQQHIPEEDCDLVCTDCEYTCAKDRSAMVRHLILAGHRAAAEE